MDSGIIRRIFYGLGANVYGQLVVVIIQLVGVPILLHYWGARLYGEWLILFAIPAYLTMTDLGLCQSAANDMTARVARRDLKGTLAVFQSLSMFVYALIVFGLAMVVLLLVALPLQAWFHFNELPLDEVRWILGLLAASVLIQLADGVNHAGFRAGGEYALHSTIYSTTLLIQQSGIWGLAIIGFGPLYAAEWHAGVRLVVTVLVTGLLFHRHRFLRPGFAYARFVELKKLLKPAIANFAMSLAMALNIQGMVLVVGSVLGPVAVVTFSTLRTLTRLTVQAVLAINHAFEPELARAWGQHDMSLLQRLYRHLFQGSLWLVLTVALSLRYLGDWIVSWWTHGKVTMDSDLFNWLLVSAVSTVLWYGSLNLLKAANRHLGAAVWYVLTAFLGLGVAFFLLNESGRLAEAGLALLLMDGLMIVYILPLASRLVGLPPGRLFAGLFDVKPYLRYFLSVRRRHAS